MNAPGLPSSERISKIQPLPWLSKAIHALSDSLSWAGTAGSSNRSTVTPSFCSWVYVRA
jgi:hypothetical protein